MFTCMKKQKRRCVNIATGSQNILSGVELNVETETENTRHMWVKKTERLFPIWPAAVVHVQMK